MADVPLPSDEQARLKALHDLGILDTPEEERFDRITRLAARLFDVPVALVTLVDADRQWAKSRVGTEHREVPRAASFCARAILGDRQLVVEDAAAHPDFARNARVTGPPHIRFYAGHVLSTPSGHRMGTLCLAAPEPRAFGPGDRAALADLGALAEQELSSTELGEALRSRAETEVRLRAVMDTVADAVVSFGDDGIIESVNDAAEDMFGLPRTFLLGECVDKLLDRVDWPGVQRLLRDGPDSVVGRQIEVVGRRASSATFPLELTVGRTRVGRRTLFVAVGRDITDRKAAERDLDRARLRTEHILEAAGEGILGVDRDGCVIWVNAAGAVSVGRDQEDMAGRPLDEVLPRERADGRLATFAGGPIEATLQDGITRRFERRVLRTDGTAFAAELVVSAPPGEESDVGAVVVFRDITERYEIDRMKDEFVSVVGHELRTPLTSIRGSLGLLAGGVLGELGPEAGRMLDIAVANTDRLVRLINDILDLERIESGTAELAREPQRVAELFTATVEVLGAVAAERGLTFRIDARDEAVLGDHDRLVQALVNLAGNAVKFSPDGATVTLRARATGDEVRLEVADRGRGVPAEDLERIFRRFEQVDASDAREKGGTGLGLAIARSIAEQHGGRIWAESEPGAGSTFFVALPRLHAGGGDRPPRPVLVVGGSPAARERLRTVLAEAGHPVAAEDADEAPLAVVVAGDPGRAPDALAALGGHHTAATPIVFVGRQSDDELLEALARAVPAWDPRRVLVVEDDVDLARVLARLLEEHGARVEVAQTGRQAIDAAERDPPDLLLLDVALPEGDGFAVVEHLRAGALARIPLVVYTARDLGTHERDRLRLGDTRILTKGRTTPAEVEHHVVRLLEALA